MLNLILGGAGCGKSRYLLELIRECAENDGKPCVFIPEQFSLQYDNKLYNALGAKNYNEVEANGFSRFAKQIFLSYGTRKGRYADEMTKSALMYLAIRDMCTHGSLNFYSNRMHAGAFVSPFLDAVKDLQLASVKPERLLSASAAMCGNIREKSQDIALLYAEYVRGLEKRGLKDALTDIAEAAVIAADKGYFRGRTVFIDEYKSFTADELEIITAALDADNVYVALDTDNPDGLSALFGTVNRTCAALRRLAEDNGIEVRAHILSNMKRFCSRDLSHLSSNILRTGKAVQLHSDNVKAIEANDIYEECEYVCAEIHRLVAEEGFRYSEIAIISRKLEDYRGVFEASAARFGLTVFMDTQKSVSSCALIRLITDALSLVGAGDFSTDTMLEYAKTRLANVSESAAERLEIYCFTHNIDGSHWLEEFTGEENTLAEEARRELTEPLLKLRESLTDKSCAELCELLYGFLIGIDIEKSILRLCTSLKENGSAEDSDNLRFIWREVIGIFDTLHATVGEEKLTIREFSELFSICAASASYATPPQVLDCITVTEMQRSRLSNPRVVFIIGANEGYFPKYTASGSLFSDRDKQQLSSSGIELSNTAEQMISNESFVAYFAASTASERLYISYPLMDSTGKSCSEAITLAQIRRLFSNDILLKTADVPILFYARTPAAAYYQYVRNYYSATVEHSALRAALLTNDEYAPRVRFLDNISARRVDRLPAELAVLCYGREMSMSNSQLEKFNKCAFMHFCRYALKLYPLKGEKFDALSTGNLVHHCVHMLFSECGGKNALLALKPDEMKTRIEKYASDFIAENLSGADNSAVQKLTFQNTVSKTLLLAKRLSDELEQTRFDFTAQDVERQLNTMCFELPDDGKIIFSGKIDRMDSCLINGEKYIRIIDYKTGKINFSPEKIPEGTDLQLLLYLFAQSEGEKALGKPAGMLYMPASAPSPELDRDSTAEKREKLISDYYRMDGLVVEDYDVVGAMETRFAEANGACKGEFLPVEFKKDGTFTAKSKVIPAHILEKMREYVYREITEAGAEIQNGEISAAPLEKACTYCDYANICRGFGEHECKDISEKLASFKNLILS